MVWFRPFRHDSRVRQRKHTHKFKINGVIIGTGYTTTLAISLSARYQGQEQKHNHSPEHVPSVSQQTLPHLKPFTEEC